MRNKLPTEEQKAAATAEVDQFAGNVFARMAAAGTRSRTFPRHARRARTVTPKPATQQQWFSGVEAALPNGDRD